MPSSGISLTKGDELWTIRSKNFTYVYPNLSRIRQLPDLSSSLHVYLLGHMADDYKDIKRLRMTLHKRASTRNTKDDDVTVLWRRQTDDLILKVAAMLRDLEEMEEMAHRSLGRVDSIVSKVVLGKIIKDKDLH
ncbi:MAG: hypothetical protein LQ346_007386 [Caloplaca aetnensis]|nr:MAG: hypothetical protein LQ346_007386 [Caloplaca aetnensis]